MNNVNLSMTFSLALVDVCIIFSRCLTKVGSLSTLSFDTFNFCTSNHRSVWRRNLFSQWCHRKLTAL